MPDPALSFPITVLHEFLVSDRNRSILTCFRLGMIIVAASGLPYHSSPFWNSIRLDFYILYELVPSAALQKAVQSFQFIVQLEISSVTQRPHFKSGRKVLELPEQPTMPIPNRRLIFRKEHISATEAV